MADEKTISRLEKIVSDSQKEIAELRFTTGILTSAFVSAVVSVITFVVIHTLKGS